MSPAQAMNLAIPSSALVSNVNDEEQGKLRSGRTEWERKKQNASLED
jgi:hypothetical protein